MSLIPAGSSPAPNHWLCRLRGHRGLSWQEREHSNLNGTKTRWIEQASCMICERPQTSIRCTYPDTDIIGVHGPMEDHHD